MSFITNAFHNYRRYKLISNNLFQTLEIKASIIYNNYVPVCLQLFNIIKDYIIYITEFQYKNVNFCSCRQFQKSTQKYIICKGKYWCYE